MRIIHFPVRLYGYSVNTCSLDKYKSHIQATLAAIKRREVVRLSISHNRHAKSLLLWVFRNNDLNLEILDIQTRYSKVLPPHSSGSEYWQRRGWAYRPISKIDFTPAETTPTEHLVSSCRSAEMSIAKLEHVNIQTPGMIGTLYALSWPPRWTPPKLKTYTVEKRILGRWFKCIHTLRLRRL